VRLGYKLDTVDGDFGPKTFEGVKTIQKIFGLNEDGIVGPKFRAKINSSCNLVITDNEETDGEPLIQDDEQNTYSEEELNRSLERMK
jgi:peptidoglycan hydrolase-like protein with peptidoglycan-binding domain